MAGSSKGRQKKGPQNTFSDNLDRNHIWSALQEVGYEHHP